MINPHQYILVLEPTEPCRSDSIRRIRRLLKEAKRCGLRCVDARQVPTTTGLEAGLLGGQPQFSNPGGAP